VVPEANVVANEEFAKSKNDGRRSETTRTRFLSLALTFALSIILQPSGQESTQAYPAEMPDARVLWQRKTPSLKVVETAEAVQGAPQGSTVASKTQPQE
jgi:hypothetical protein